MSDEDRAFEAALLKRIEQLGKMPSASNIVFEYGAQWGREYGQREARAEVERLKIELESSDQMVAIKTKDWLEVREQAMRLRQALIEIYWSRDATNELHVVAMKALEQFDAFVAGEGKQ